MTWVGVGGEGYGRGERWSEKSQTEEYMDLVTTRAPSPRTHGGTVLTAPQNCHLGDQKECVCPGMLAPGTSRVPAGILQVCPGRRHPGAEVRCCRLHCMPLIEQQ